MSLDHTLIVYLGSFGVAPPWLYSYGSALVSVSEDITAAILSVCFHVAPPPLTSFSLLFLSFSLQGDRFRGHSHFLGMETGFHIILRDSFAEGPSVANCQEEMGFLTLCSLVMSC